LFVYQHHILSHWHLQTAAFEEFRIFTAGSSELLTSSKILAIDLGFPPSSDLISDEADNLSPRSQKSSKRRPVAFRLAYEISTF
jgi:hypothetical protein